MHARAALAMWWDMAPEQREEFEHWHSHEHFAERLALPGFERGSRWADADAGEGFFVLYELTRHEALSSPEYLARLNAPSPWSRKMMPHHRNMVRSPCRVAFSHGAAVSAQVLTVRISPSAGAQDRLRAHLALLLPQLARQPGLAGAHLLVTEVPEMAATTEQKIRGLADRAADWVLLVHGYDARALQALAADALGEASLQAAGAAPGAVAGRYGLRLSACRASDL